MDPFTQRMFEKAEQRSRQLGVGKVSQFPLSEQQKSGGGDADVMQSAPAKQHPVKQRAPAPPRPVPCSSSGSKTKLQVIEAMGSVTDNSSSASPSKVLRQFTAVDKENMDVGIEINIMTDKDVEVQVEVEERDAIGDNQQGSGGDVNQPSANLRDTSRNLLQRLGALYSNTDISSPIHRTEGDFHAEDTGLDGSPKRPKQRYDKLAALASTINQWEDDTDHPPYPHQALGAVPPPKPDLPSRHLKEALNKAPAEAPPVPLARHTQKSANEHENNQTKQLKWDPTMINSLEAQGFQRRESSTVKVSYDYAREHPQTEEGTDCNTKGTASKTANSYAAHTTATEKKPTAVVHKVTGAKSGLVSGRAAVFEQKASTSKQQNAVQQQQSQQKDPTELSLRERMQLFERNKGEALVPKAPFGMAPPISKIRQDNATKKDDNKASTSANAAFPSAAARPAPALGGSKLRDKVAALVASATISENKIRADIQKQREEDMQLLANRFNRQKEVFTKPQAQQHQQATQPKTSTATSSSQAKCPPPPPPLPTFSLTPTTNRIKRRSPGDAIDEESKRAKTTGTVGAQHRLYPALSDLGSSDSLTDNDNGNCCTTATVSTNDEMGQRARQHVDVHDEDDHESYMESETDDSTVGACNGSWGREILNSVQKKERQDDQQQRKSVKGVTYAEKNSYYGGGDSSLNSSDGSVGVDDYLDEAFEEDEPGDGEYGDGDIPHDSTEEDEENTSRASHGSKGTTASNSFSFRKAPGTTMNCQTITEEESDECQTPASIKTDFSQPVKSELSVNQQDENLVTLVHTVSFYRRQQNTNTPNSTPVRKVCREQQVMRNAMVELASAAQANLHYESPHADIGCSQSTKEDESESDVDTDESYLIQEKIKKLLDDVCKQQQVIAQTSQALNLCAATIEFSGSTESVEGERHLLVATHRRQACLEEVQRLRIEKTLRPLGAPKEKGCLTVREIILPLRQDYMRKLAADTISGHHLVCLLKYNEYVLSTKTVPTLPGLFSVKFPDVLQLNNVYADFRITLEIYGMTAHREVLPHEVKYHINLNKKSGIKTPKKKGSDNRLVMPPVQSPAGPHVVRTPALVQYGFAIFSMREIQRTSWTLTKVLGVSPLEGVVHMKVNCELSVSVEHKGFLTMFEDISGFGAWHRRWCHLNGTVLNYWKYPDDEKKKTPMGSIDLYTCCSQKITTVPRDICARLNTILLECQRPAMDSDQESLIIVPNGRTTIVRHLLSADTREEREEWCAYFNKALTLMRAWGPPQ